MWFVPNGVGPEFFRSRVNPAGLATKLLFVGNWIDHKGIYYLKEAFEQLLASLPGIRLTIGEAVARKNMCGVTSGLRSSIFDICPIVPRSEMPALYADHDIFVLPSLVEGMPLVLLEAMASGLPVVTTESSGMTDLVENGHDGAPADYSR